MTYISKVRVGVTCTASAATYLVPVDGGFLYAIGYTPGTASGFATGSTTLIDVISDIRATALGPTTHGGITFTNSSVAGFFYPRQKPQTTALATAADLTNAQMIPIATPGHIRIVVASGGASGNAWFDFFLQSR